MEKIVVIDFGGQYAHLITNRLRRLGYYSEIWEDDEVNDLHDVKGFILSGGPNSVYAEGAPQLKQEILDSQLPILGLCYGHQLLARTLGGEVSRADTREYGLAELEIEENALFGGLDKIEVVWMSHGDMVSKLPEGFEVIGFTKDCPFAAMANDSKKIYGLQFHPEVAHTKKGNVILENFASQICNVAKEWNMSKYYSIIAEEIKDDAKDKKVFLLVSGGVDSLVLFTLLNKILGKERVLGVHIDNGLMRKDESKKIENYLHENGFDNLKVVDSSQEFLDALKDIYGPEEKRKIIGEKFIDVAEKEMEELDEDWILAQGTIYPDTIESKGTKNSTLIKTHHNRIPKMMELIEKGYVIEPLKNLYKDEVRALGRELGLPEELIERHPFPGPGLGVRILCNQGDKVAEIHEKGIILPIKSVGVQGDSRTYKKPLVIPHEGKDWESLDQEARDIINSFEEVNRVLIKLNEKDISQIKSKDTFITNDRVKILQEIDDVVNDFITKSGLNNKVWQFPVVLIPISNQEKESIVLRPIESKDAMTANFFRFDSAMLDDLTKEIQSLGLVENIFFDITNKPSATIEWE